MTGDRSCNDRYKRHRGLAGNKMVSHPRTSTYNELIQLRDRSGLSRQDFYLQMFEKAELVEKVEVNGIKIETECNQQFG